MNNFIGWMFLVFSLILFINYKITEGTMLLILTKVCFIHADIDDIKQYLRSKHGK